jgi:hypothetical protein
MNVQALGSARWRRAQLSARLPQGAADRKLGGTRMSHRTGRGLVEWFLRTGTLSTVAWPINSHKCAWPIGCPARIGVTKPLDACLSVMDNKATKACGIWGMPPPHSN